MTGYIGQSKHSENCVPAHVCVCVCVFLCVATSSRNTTAFCHMCADNQGTRRYIEMHSLTDGVMSTWAGVREKEREAWKYFPSHSYLTPTEIQTCTSPPTQLCFRSDLTTAAHINKDIHYIAWEFSLFRVGGAPHPASVNRHLWCPYWWSSTVWKLWLDPNDQNPILFANHWPLTYMIKAENFQ